MALAEVQGALARLYVDPALRERFFADPPAVGAELALGAEEVRMLAGISRRQVEQFAEALRRKRRDQVRRVIPITARALGERYGRLFERYAGESAPRGSKADLDDAAGFVVALGRWADDGRPPWAVDIARYELAWRQAARAGCRPVLRAFRYPVARLIRGRATNAAIVPRPTLAIWWRPTSRGRIRHLVLTIPWLGSFLEPRAPLSEIADAEPNQGRGTSANPRGISVELQTRP
jgi:hypothetical protein